MLTPDKIKEKTFQTTGRGSYRAEDVDSFLIEVSASYEQMFKENADLIRKISIFAKKIEEYRADEESLKMALLNAQKLADRIVAEAKENAANEVASVKGETDKLRADAAADAAALEANAKHESETLLADAKNEAEKILADANAQAKEILGNINRKVTHESLVYEMIQKEASEFKANLVAMYKEHINLINQLPEIVDNQLDEEEKAEFEAEVAEPEEEATVVEEPVDEAEDIVVIDEPEEIIVIDEEPVVEEVVQDEETVEELPNDQEEKKTFKIDLSRVDFTEEYEEDTAPAQVSMLESFEVVEDDDAQDDDDDDSQSISFKNFFKKK